MSVPPKKPAVVPDDEKKSDPVRHVSAAVSRAAGLWLRDVAAKQRRTLGFIMREALDDYYRKIEGAEPPWGPNG